MLLPSILNPLLPLIITGLANPWSMVREYGRKTNALNRDTAKGILSSETAIFVCQKNGDGMQRRRRRRQSQFAPRGAEITAELRVRS